MQMDSDHKCPAGQIHIEFVVGLLDALPHKHTHPDAVMPDQICSFDPRLEQNKLVHLPKFFNMFAFE